MYEIHPSLSLMFQEVYYSSSSVIRPLASKTALGYKTKNRCTVFARQMTKIQNSNIRLSCLWEITLQFFGYDVD